MRRRSDIQPEGATWQAGNAAWWAVTVVVAGFAIAVFTVLRTVSAVSEERTAVHLLETALHLPTEDAVEAALADAGPDQERLTVAQDLLAFDVPAADARQDVFAVVDTAVEDRAAHLYTQGIPGDPGPQRTAVGLPRQLVSALSADNHEAVDGAVRFAAILAVALLGLTTMQGRKDNLLMLPAAALATGWLIATAVRQAADVLLTDIGPASPETVRVVDGAASVPMSQLSFAAVGGLAAAAVYRILVIAQQWWARRAAHAAQSAVVTEDHLTSRAEADLHEVGPGPDDVDGLDEWLAGLTAVLPTDLTGDRGTQPIGDTVASNGHHAGDGRNGHVRPVPVRRRQEPLVGRV